MKVSLQAGHNGSLNSSRRASGRWAPCLPLLWLLAIPVLNICYGLLNRPGAEVYSLVTAWDERLPFLPVFAIPYLIWYPFIFITLFAILRRSPAAYYRTLLGLCLGLVVCYGVYAVFQTTVARPDLPETGFFNRLLGFVYATDRPFNCFPSIHVLTSYLMIKGARVFGWKARLLVAALAAAVIVSTVLVRQHVLADAAGAS
ncbi:phosphatase PAP2 family protein [Paenibacillus sp. CC-CFT747]|nr:phosphatase PAP2 family protein [Paenibacillus sp. CC-CFT747]